MVKQTFAKQGSQAISFLKRVGKKLPSIRTMAQITIGSATAVILVSIVMILWDIMGVI